MRDLYKAIGTAYLRLFTFVEGTELEPNIFHSHFLSVRAVKTARERVRHYLRGDVLDVGAGTGHGAEFVDAEARYFPTDVKGARDYRNRAISRKGRPLVKECSVYDIAYPQARFDACLALSLMEHLEEPESAIAEMRRVVKEGGSIVLLVPFCFPVHGYPNDYWRWTVSGMSRWLEARGVEPIDCFPCGKTLHSIFLSMNLFLREGILLKGHRPTAPRVALYAILRPLLTVLFFLVNVSALALGLLDRSTTSPIMVCAVGRNRG